MNWSYGGVMEIFSVGDGLFMARVLQAVAGMASAGTLNSLGIIGLLLGMFLIGFKAIATGRAEIHQIFAGLILFLVMFGGTTRVMITDIGLAPGEVNEQTYVVDNVPFGVAVMGSMISRMSVALSERMEQAYGSVHQVATLREVGFGRSLDWLAAVRFAKAHGGTSVPRLEYFRQNLAHYMMNCSSRMFISNPGRAATAASHSDPLAVSGGFGYESDGTTTSWLNESTGESGPDLTCTAALAKLKAYADGPNLFQDFSRAVAGRNMFAGSSNVQTQASEAFQSLGLDPTQAQQYIKGALARASWMTALPRIPYLSSEQSNQLAMMVAAAEQSATQNAAEETMFRRLMRPLMAFFESLVYAAAPFMAFVAGFGAIGLKMVGKYALVTMWVALWIPTLAIINQFQLLMAQRAIASVLSPAGGGTPLPVGSLTGSHAVETVAIDWINTGAMLAASTPVITLMILFGSAMTAVSLANSIKGHDHINEKVASPDAVAPAPVTQAKPLEHVSVQGGNVAADAPIPSVSYSDIKQASVASRQVDATASTTSWAQTHGKAINEAVASDIMRSVTGQSGLTFTATQQQRQVADAVYGHDVSAGRDTAATTTLSQTLALAKSGGLALDAGAIVRGAVKATLGDAAKKNPEGRAAAIADMAKGFRLGLDAKMTDTEIAQRIANVVQNSTDRYTSALKAGVITAGDLSGAVASGVNTAAREGHSSVASVTGSTTYQKSQSDMVSRQQQFDEAQSAMEGNTTGQSLGYNQISQSWANAGMIEKASTEAMRLGSTEAYEYALNSALKQQLYGDPARNMPMYQGHAAIAVLTNQVPGFSMDRPDASPTENAQAAASRRAAFDGLITESGVKQVATGGLEGNHSYGEGGFAPERYRNPDDSLTTGVNTSATVEGAGVGASPGTEQRARAGIQPGAEGRVAAQAGVDQANLDTYAGAAQANADGTFSGQGEFSAIPAAAHAANKEVVEDKASAVHAEMQRMEKDNTAASVAGAGLMQAGKKGALFDMRLGVDSSQIRQSHVRHGTISTLPEFASSDNPAFAQAKEDAMAGRTLGVPVPENVATVLAGIHAGKSTEGFSQGQWQEVKAAYESLSPDLRNAAHNIDFKWDAGASRPNFVNPAAARALSLGNEGFERSHKYKEESEELWDSYLRAIGAADGPVKKSTIDRNDI